MPVPDIMEAAANFSIFEGTMLLALSDGTLDSFAGEPDSHGSRDTPDDDQPLVQQNGARKRGAAAPMGNPNKNARSNTPGLYFPLRLRGREMGEGDVLPDPRRGYIEFTDDSYASFRGVVDISLVGDGIEFTGWKVDGVPRRRAEPWNEIPFC